MPKKAYSNYFEIQLDKSDFGRPDYEHFKKCNQLLLIRLLEFDREGRQLHPDYSNDSLAKKIILKSKQSLPIEDLTWEDFAGRAPSKDLTWEHCSSKAAQGRLGVMRLVPRSQHTAASEFWRILHPDHSNRGGYHEWAVPAGAPSRSQRPLDPKTNINALELKDLPEYFKTVVAANQYDKFKQLLRRAEELKCTPAQYQAIFTQPYKFGRDGRLTTLLHIASANGYQPFIKSILRAGGDAHKMLQAVNAFGATPAHIAAASNRGKLLDFFIRLHADPKIKDRKGRTVFDIAYNNASTSCFTVLKKNSQAELTKSRKSGGESRPSYSPATPIKIPFKAFSVPQSSPGTIKEIQSASSYATAKKPPAPPIAKASGTSHSSTNSRRLFAHSSRPQQQTQRPAGQQTAQHAASPHPVATKPPPAPPRLSPAKASAAVLSSTNSHRLVGSVGNHQQQAQQRAQLQALQRGQQQAQQRAQLQALQRGQQQAQQRTQLQALQRGQQQARQRAQLQALQRGQIQAQQRNLQVANQQRQLQALQRGQIQAQQRNLQAANQQRQLQALQRSQIQAQQRNSQAANQQRQQVLQRGQQQIQQRVAQSANQRATQAAAERARQQAAERIRQQAAERVRQQAAERARQQAAERARQQAAERARQQAAERARQQAAERARQQAERARQQAAERARQQAAERARQQAIERARADQARQAAQQRAAQAAQRGPRR